MDKKLVADELIRIAKRISAKESGKVEYAQPILDKLHELENFLHDMEYEYNHFVEDLFDEIYDKFSIIRYDYFHQVNALKQDKNFEEIDRLYI